MKIVLANSIGIDRHGYYIIHSPSRWSEGVRNAYHWFAYYPWELAYLSSLLKKNTRHQVMLVDGCQEQLAARPYAARILAEHPDMLVVESATRMIDENVALALQIKEQLGTTLVFVGQHATAFPERLLAQGIDYVCQGEYEYAVLELARGTSQERIPGLYPNQRRPLLDITTLPWPEDDDVSRYAYGFPGEPSSEYHEIQMYASRGCPMSCSFCVARHVYYQQPNWRPRRVDDVVAEIRYLAGKYPRLKGIFFDEETHNGSPVFIRELCAGLCAAGLERLRYEAMCDLRLLDDEMLRQMRHAGYYKVRVGIESASAIVLDQMGKTLPPNIVKERLAAVHRAGIATYGTFMFGSPGANQSEDRKTVQLIRELLDDDVLDNLQISLCTPQPGTPLYEQALRKGWLRESQPWSAFDGGGRALLSYPGYRASQIERVKQRAVLVRDHGYLWQKLRRRRFFHWIAGILRRYGIIGSLVKGMRRGVAEVWYHLGR